MDHFDVERLYVMKKYLSIKGVLIREEERGPWVRGWGLFLNVFSRKRPEKL